MKTYFNPIAGVISKHLKLSIVVGCLGLVQMALANELTNGGFESGLAGWNTSISSDAGVGTGYPAHSGSAGFWGYDNAGWGVLSQTFATDIGQSYDISFWAGNYDLANNSLTYDIQGVTAATLVSAALYPGFNLITGSFTATATSSTLEFNFHTVPGTGILTLDDVSVTASESVPEGGSIVVLLGSALLGFAALRRRFARA